MNTEVESIHNHHERTVLDRVRAMAPRHPQLDADLLADVACVALNRLAPRYIRHEVDLAFYMTDKERLRTEREVDQAVKHAFEFVQARAAMRART